MAKKDQPLPILHQPRPADVPTVETLHITAEYVRAGKPFLEVGPAFMAAHDALQINIKWDRASNAGWVTAAEAEAIRAHMDAAL